MIERIVKVSLTTAVLAPALSFVLGCLTGQQYEAYRQTESIREAFQSGAEHAMKHYRGGIPGQSPQAK